MNILDVCASISSGLPALFECTPAPREGIRVRTPLMYPDGTIVDIFVLDRGGSYTLTDFGETLGWLRMQSVTDRRTPNQRRLVDDVCQTLGVELYRGQLVLRGCALHELSEAIVRIAQAAVRVSDIWFTMRRRVVQSVSNDVSRWLAEREIRFEANVKHRGTSGREWTIDFQTYSNGHTAPPRPSLVFLLSAPSQAAVRRVTSHVVAACHDLNELRVRDSRPKFVSLFDDRADVWRREDYRLVSQLSTVATWSRRNELERFLRDT